jgi:hypothetical protein
VISSVKFRSPGSGGRTVAHLAHKGVLKVAKKAAKKPAKKAAKKKAAKK